MYGLQRGNDVIIDLSGGGQEERPRASPKAAPLWSTRVFGRFRRFFMCFVFALPSGTSPPATPRGDEGSPDEAAKGSFSSYRYSSSSHYHEAIEDCIEFFNRSAQVATPGGQNPETFLV